MMLNNVKESIPAGLVQRREAATNTASLLGTIGEMDNFFITKYFDWQIKRTSDIDRALNLITRRFGFKSDTAGLVDTLIHRVTGLSLSPTRSGISTSIEQRINMYHLVSQVLTYEVYGDLVEVGCNEGQSAVLMKKVIDSHGSHKRLHVYDSFEGLTLQRREGWLSV